MIVLLLKIIILFWNDFSRTFDTQEAYILIYKLKEESNNINLKYRFNFFGLMNTAYNIYLKRKEFKYFFNYLVDIDGKIVEEYFDNCYFYYGEPIIYKDKRGYIICGYKKEDNSFYLKIKFKDKLREIKYDPKKIIKETLKDNNLIREHKKFKFINDKITCTNDCSII